jgi:Cof subfamily protein (haloacid dehalogenase superfamily)
MLTSKGKLPKLVSSDISGTLLRGKSEIPSFTVNVLNQLVNHVPVALITGYNYHTTLTFTRELDQRILLMPQNGTLCIKEKKLLWEYRIPQYAACELYEYLDENNLPIIIYKGKIENFKNFYVHQDDIPSLSYGFQRINRLKHFENITGISTLLPDDKARTIKGIIESIVGDKFKVIYTREARDSWLEVVHSEVRKDLALKRLCGELSIPLSDVVYFGDNFNDRELLQIVGYPVLVENAAPELKEEFPTVIPSVYQEGVAHYLDDLYHLNIS